MKLFYLFPDPTSRTSIAQPGHRYGGQASLWYGMDQANRFGHTVDADLYHRSKRTRIENVIDRLINNIWSAMGGSGGNWFHILALRKPLARADLIISTADRVGIPLVLLMAVGLVPSRPILYMSIGLPERWDKMRAPMRRLYRWAFQKQFPTSCATATKSHNGSKTFSPTIHSRSTFSRLVSTRACFNHVLLPRKDPSPPSVLIRIEILIYLLKWLSDGANRSLSSRAPRTRRSSVTVGANSLQT